MVHSKKLYGGKAIKSKAKTMKKTSSPTLYKIGSVSSMTSRTKSINLQNVLFKNLKCDSITIL